MAAFKTDSKALPYVAPTTIRLPFNIRVLLWNIHGPSDTGLAERRNTVVPQVIQELHPDVISYYKRSRLRR